MIKKARDGPAGLLGRYIVEVQDAGEPDATGYL
jgi:hypothetical protein